MTWKCFSYEDQTTLVQALADRIIVQLQAAITARGGAWMAVSGGRTPEQLLSELAMRELDWSRVTVTLVDERWVTPSHPDSNARLVQATLLQGPAAAARFLPLYNGAIDPFVAAPQVQERLRELPLPLDVVLLGMGADGHTASWFPGAAELTTALEPAEDLRCCALTAPRGGHPRLTLTLPMVLASRLLVLQLLGADKYEVLQRAMQPGSMTELPVRAVLHQSQTPVQIYYGEQP